MRATAPVGTSERSEPEALVRITVEHPAAAAMRTGWTTCAGE